MATALKFIPPRVPLTDPKTGLVSREWYLFLQGMFDRIGGASSTSNTELLAAIEALVVGEMVTQPTAGGSTLPDIMQPLSGLDHMSEVTFYAS